MNSIDIKDKEINKLKLMNKDNRRSQMIQALQSKLNEQEVVVDLVKEELVRRGDLSQQDINDLIIRKTLSGPKRIRPLTREEMENKIIDLEKKLNKKTSTGSSANLKSDVSARNDEAMAENYDGIDGIPRQTHHDSGGGGLDDDAKESSDGSGFLSRVVHFLEEIDSLRAAVDSREGVIDLQQEEIMRLRARNAELVSSEEEVAYHAQQSAELRAHNASLVESLEDTTRKLAEALEGTLRARAENALVADDQKTELSAVRRQCEKLLQQNASLLQNLSSLELELESCGLETSKSMQRSQSAEQGMLGLDQQVRQLTDKLHRAEERLASSEARAGAQEVRLAQVDTLKEQLRDRSITIKELRRAVEERDRAIASLKAGSGSGSNGRNSTSTSALNVHSLASPSLSPEPPSRGPVASFESDAKADVRRSMAK